MIRESLGKLRNRFVKRLEIDANRSILTYFKLSRDRSTVTLSDICFSPLLIAFLNEVNANAQVVFVSHGHDPVHVRSGALAAVLIDGYVDGSGVFIEAGNLGVS